MPLQPTLITQLTLRPSTLEVAGAAHKPHMGTMRAASKGRAAGAAPSLGPTQSSTSATQGLWIQG